LKVLLDEPTKTFYIEKRKVEQKSLWLNGKDKTKEKLREFSSLRRSSSSTLLGLILPKFSRRSAFQLLKLSFDFLSDLSLTINRDSLC
jgi:hypothetical protein